MWWKLFLLTLYMIVLFVLSRILETVAYYEGGYLASRLLDPVSLGVRKLKTILDQRGVSYAGVVERQELTDLVETSGEVTEGELESATLAEETTTTTNFSCGGHFYEEVEDTKDSVWVVQVVPDGYSNFMRSEDWQMLIRKVSHFGIRAGVFDCTLDKRYCQRKKWFTPRLVLALPNGYKQKANVTFRNYMNSNKVQAIFEWINFHLASRIVPVSSYDELTEEWYSYDNADSNSKAKLRVILFSAMNIPPMFYSALSVKYSGRAKFGTVDVKTKSGKAIQNRLRMRHIPTYQVLMPENNVTYGHRPGEYLNYNSMALFLKTLHPEVNDIFLFSMVFINMTCWLEFFITPGQLFKRLGSLLWMLGKWNCLLILLWLPVLGLFQLPCMEVVLSTALKLLRLVGTTDFASSVRHDWLWYTSVSCCFLVCTFLLFAVAVGVLHYFWWPPQEEAAQPAGAQNTALQSDWWNFNWDYMSYLFRPMATLTRPISTQDMDLEVGMELLIERLAVPNFWLRPMISPDYIKELPVWKYTGPCIDSDVGSDVDVAHVESDEEPGYKSDSSVVGPTFALSPSKAPLLFVCEKCRALQNNRENVHKSQEELEQERLESESACAKFLMDGDYKCQCQQDHVVHRSPKKERYKRSRSMSDSEAVLTSKMRCTEKDKEDNDDSAWESPVCRMPPGMLACTECSICLESYKFGTVLCGLPCGHSFHEHCIMGWLTRDNHCCPICRWPAYKAKPCSMHLHVE